MKIVQTNFTKGNNAQPPETRFLVYQNLFIEVTELPEKIDKINKKNELVSEAKLDP